MEGGTTLEPHRLAEEIWIMAPGLDTLASASADSEPVVADGRIIGYQQKKRKNPYDGIFGNGKNSDMDKTDLLADALAAVIEPQRLISGTADQNLIRPYPTVGTSAGKAPTTKAAPKVKAAPKTAGNKTPAQAKLKAVTAAVSAPSSSFAKSKKAQNDSDSSDSDSGAAPVQSSLPSSSGQQIASEGLSSGDVGVESVVVIPQRALTVRERHRFVDRLCNELSRRTVLHFAIPKASTDVLSKKS